MDGGLSVDHPWIQDRGWEMGLVRRVWKMLAFQAEARVGLIGRLGFSFNSPIQKICRVELDAGLCRKDFHFSAGLWVP